MDMKDKSIIRESLSESRVTSICTTNEPIVIVPHDGKGSTGRNSGAQSQTFQETAVLDALKQLQNQKSSWAVAAGIFAISLLLFTGTVQAERSWETILLLILVITFHECGHFAAMKFYGYRNMKMFFIPYFGAAVSGRNYNIVGWKKVFVALAGPFPGIILGTVIGAAGLVLDEPRVFEGALMLLILNGINLLPLLPLDGGSIVHTLLFVRRPALDVVFRITAALGLCALAVLLDIWILTALAVVMLLIIPVRWHLARAVFRLKRENAIVVSPDDRAISHEAALRILREIRSVLPSQTKPKVMAAHVTDVYEMLNTHPPGVVASFGLLTLYAASFLLALIMTGIITSEQNRRQIELELTPLEYFESLDRDLIVPHDFTRDSD